MKLAAKVSVTATALLLLLSFSLPQALGHGSYTYNIDGETVPGPQAYRVVGELYGDDLGVGPLRDPRDVVVSPNGRVYIADSGNDRILILDKHFNLLQVIEEFENGAEASQFSQPTGLFVTAEEKLYIADYGNRRVVVLDDKHRLQRIIENPTDHELIPEDFRFRPTKLVVDRAGRIFVIAEGVLEGLMEFDEQGRFTGYIGAPRVHPNPWDYFWRRVMTEAQKERSIIFVPTEYSSAAIDDKGFIYTTLLRGQANVRQRIRRLNPAGDDVLRRRTDGFAPPMGDVDFIEEAGNPHASVVGSTGFIDVVVRADGIYSALDATRGRIFTYDDNGNLLYAFGSPAYEKGSFRSPAAIAALGDSLLVLDRRTNLLAVLEPTAYAEGIHAAIASYQTGDYDGSADIWREVLKQNPNLDLAYSGIGRSLLRQGEFAEAMRVYRLADDRTGYSQALALYRRDWINDNFSYLMGGLFLFVGLIQAGRKIRQRGAKGDEGYRGLAYEASEHKLKAFGQGIAYAFTVIFRPISGFWDLKHEKRGSAATATALLGGVIITYVLTRQYTGFLFNWKEAKDLNIYLEISSVLIPFFLWCLVNLGLTSLMDGKGSFKDIYIATAYALFPVILINIPLILVSHVITLDEGAFYYLALAFAVIWPGALIFLGSMVTHQYELGKNVITSILTVAGMAVVIFLTLLFINVIAQLYGFIESIYTEVSFRL